MKVRLKIGYNRHEAGSEIDIDDGVAETLVFCDRAERVKEEPQKKRGRPKCVTK